MKFLKKKKYGSGNWLNKCIEMKKYRFLLLILIIFHLGSNLIWLSMNRSEPVHDESGYYLKSLRIFRILSGDSTRRSGRLLALEPRHRPPFFPLLPSLIYPFAGPSFPAACLVSTGFFLFAVFMVYLTGTSLSGPAVGLGAAFIYSFYPYNLEYSRRFYSEPVLAALFILALYLLHRRRLFEKRKYSCGLGLVLGLGMMTKQNFGLFILTPFLLISVRALFSRSLDRLEFRRRIINLLLALLFALLIAAPFYLNLSQYMDTGIQSIRDQAELWREPGDTGGPADFISHLFSLERLMGPVFFLFFLAGLISAFRRRSRPKNFLLITLGGGYLLNGLFFLFFINEDRHIAPLLPVTAVLTGLWLSKIARKRTRYFLLGVVLTAALLVYLRVSWGWPGPKTGRCGIRFELGPVREFLEVLPDPRPPVPQADWKIEEILEFIRKDCGGKEVSIYVVPRLSSFRADNFQERIIIRDLPGRVYGSPWRLGELNYYRLFDADYIVTKTGPVRVRGARPDYSRDVTRFLTCPHYHWQNNHSPVKEFPLPDGSRARLIKRVIPATADERFRFRSKLDDASRSLPTRSWTVSRPRVAADGETVVVAYCDELEGESEIFASLSRDGGKNWTVQPLARHTADPRDLSLASSRRIFFLTWSDRDEEGRRNIFSRTGTDAGTTWEFERVTRNPGRSTQPSAAVGGRDRYLVWIDSSYGPPGVFYKRGEIGKTFTDFQALSTTPGHSSAPSLALSPGSIHVVWEDDSYGDYEIFYRRSTNNGRTWEFRRLTDNPGNSRSPALAAIGTNLHLVWEDDSYEKKELVYKRSTDNGLSWETRRLTHGSGESMRPALDSDGKNLFLAFIREAKIGKEGEHPLKIVCRTSTDNGESWNSRVLSVATSVPSGPFLAAGGGSAHIVWIDGTFEEPELLYRKIVADFSPQPSGKQQ